MREFVSEQSTKHLAQEYPTTDNMKRIIKIHVTKHQTPKTCYQAPENIRPKQKPFSQALTDKVLALQPPWARFTDPALSHSLE